ncbi:hypothetical protein [Kiloniella sp.]|uniref:hypothetical protein n=1 Tax=Kiloniella sp. TaxID=1938587 RepID=UPI003B022D35
MITVEYPFRGQVVSKTLDVERDQRDQLELEASFWTSRHRAFRRVQKVDGMGGEPEKWEITRKEGMDRERGQRAIQKLRRLKLEIGG